MNLLPIGTRSILFGAHQNLIHPLFLAAAWWKLYGIPLSPRLWLAFFLHDIGYIGKRNIDGPEGRMHPELGAKIMQFICGQEWGTLCLHHSREYARKYESPTSNLCWADKLAFALEPEWLYLPRVILSGEIHEFMHNAPEHAVQGKTLYQRARCWLKWAQEDSRQAAFQATRQTQKPNFSTL